jgi:hypothetical protein
MRAPHGFANAINLVSAAEGGGINRIERAPQSADRITAKPAVRGHAHRDLRVRRLQHGSRRARQQDHALAIDAPHHRVARKGLESTRGTHGVRSISFFKTV